MNLFVLVIKAPTTRGRLFVFVQFRPLPRMTAASHPYLVTLIIWKAASSIHLVFNILNTSNNSQAASIFQKVRENIRVLAAIFNLFSSNQDPDNFKAVIRYTQYSKYCIVVLIPSLHHFFRTFGRISGSWRPFLIFFL